MESINHLLIKKKAIKELKKRGFKNSEIHIEYRISHYIVDVAGIKENFKIAFEAGDLTHPNKIEVLSQFFDKVIHLPYIPYRSSSKETKDILIQNIPNDVYFKLIELKGRMKCASWRELMEKLVEAD